MKLGKRLQQIDHMVINRYDHIWDCCCDHGFLGLNLLARRAADNIHFVDIAPLLIDALSFKIQKHQSDKTETSNLKSKWHAHCLSAEKISLQTNTSNLIIIAGVGGELLIEIVDAIISSHADKDLEFLLCPVHHTYKVRQALIRHGLGLIDEKLVKENKRFYELIHVATNVKRPLSNVGSVMWDTLCTEHRTYLSETLSHYERILKTDDENLTKRTQKIIADYRQVQL